MSVVKWKATLSTLVLSKVSRIPTVEWTVILTDLPAEVLFAILERLDPISLHHLALTCRYLHVLSLPALYERYLQPDVSQRILINGVTYPILPALRLALFMRRVEHVIWKLDCRRRHTFSELAQLSRFISHTTSIGNIRIDFGTSRKVLGWRVRRETVNVWKMLITRLFEIAASKAESIFIRDNLDTSKQQPKLGGFIPKFWIPYPETGERFRPTFMVMLKKLPGLVVSLPRAVGSSCVDSVAITSPNTVVAKIARDRRSDDALPSTTWFNSLSTGYSNSTTSRLHPAPMGDAVTQHAYADAPEYEFVDSDTPLEAEYEFLEASTPPNQSTPHLLNTTVLPQVEKVPKYTVNHLTLDSLSLVQEPFLPWTLDFMNRTSLTTLDVCVNQATVDFFVKVHVPSLEEFTYTSGVVDLNDLVWFLQRHPAIEVARFRHTHITRDPVVTVKGKQDPAITERCVGSPSTSTRCGSPYPYDTRYGDRIKHLEASSRIYNHLREAGFQFPNIKSLTLELVDFDGSQSYRDDELTAALSTCKAEYLCFSFPKQHVGAGHLLSWFGSTVHNRATLRQLQNLHSVRYLSIYAGALSAPQLFQRSEKWVNFWSLWFTKIPKLEMVNFHHVFCDYKLDVTDKYMHAMTRRTPGLSFGVNGQMRHLGAGMTGQAWDEFVDKTSGFMFPVSEGTHFRRRNAPAMCD